MQIFCLNYANQRGSNGWKTAPTGRGYKENAHTDTVTEPATLQFLCFSWQKKLRPHGSLGEVALPFICGHLRNLRIKTAPAPPGNYPCPSQQ